MTLFSLEWSRRLIAVLGSTVGVIIITVAVVLVASREAQPGTTAPSIAWSPSRLVVTVMAGSSITVTTTATVNSSILATTAWLVPALSQYGSVTPSNVPAISGGTSQILQITFRPPETTLPQVIQGTLHLRAGTKTIAQPLPVTLNIVWPRIPLSIPGMSGVSVTYPPSFVAAPSESPSDGVGFYSSPQAYSEGISPSFNISFATLAAGADLSDWAKSDTEAVPVSIGNRQYYQSSESIGDGQGSTSFSTLLGTNQIVVFTVFDQSLLASPAFLSTLSSLTAP